MIVPSGSESNVEIVSSNFGNMVAFIIKVPDNPLSNKISKYLPSHNIDIL